jgi:hypothetical protein
MDNDKSILEKFTDTVKDIANIATDAASYALSADQPALKDEKAVAYMPLAADGFVSDPMLVAPIAGARKKKRAATKPAAKKTATKAVKKSTKKKSVKKTAKRPTAKRPRTMVKKTAKKPAKKASRKTAGKSAKR